MLLHVCDALPQYLHILHFLLVHNVHHESPQKFLMNLQRRSPLGWYELTYSGPSSSDTLIREFLIWGNAEYTVVMWECHHVEMLIHGRFGQHQKSQLCAGTYIGSVSLWRKMESVTWFVISQHHTFIFRVFLVFHNRTCRVSLSTCSRCTCWFQHTNSSFVHMLLYCILSVIWLLAVPHFIWLSLPVGSLVCWNWKFGTLFVFFEGSFLLTHDTSSVGNKILTLQSCIVFLSSWVDMS